MDEQEDPAGLVAAALETLLTTDPRLAAAEFGMPPGAVNGSLWNRYATEDMEGCDGKNAPAVDVVHFQEAMINRDGGDQFLGLRFFFNVYYADPHPRNTPASRACKTALEKITRRLIRVVMSANYTTSPDTPWWDVEPPPSPSMPFVQYHRRDGMRKAEVILQFNVTDRYNPEW